MNNSLFKKKTTLIRRTITVMKYLLNFPKNLIMMKIEAQRAAIEINLKTCFNSIW